LYFGKFYSFFQNKELFYKKSINFHIIKSIFDCPARLKKLPKSFYFIDGWDGSFISNIIQRFLILKGGKRIFLNTGLFPGLKNRTLNLFKNNKISLNLIFWFFKQVIKVLYNRFNALIFCPKPTYLLVSGNVSYKLYNKSPKSIKLINTHSFDYEEYLNLKNKPMDKQLQNSVVYLDQDLEGNYEFLLNNFKFPATKDFHWKSLNIFLNNISKRLNTKVHIAAHPRRDKNLSIDTDYKVFYGQTADLIKNSSLVLVHNSVALSYAILFNKPILFITTNEIKKFSKEIDFSIKKFANVLNTLPVNINLFNDFEKYDFLNYDQTAYKDWNENYIKSQDSKNKSLWPDFIKTMESDN
jgi:hypothetical protein